eukprot:m.6468 g.6468  ORF g.6468 m.6468 type:complete len:53 (+) comp15969_c0_seq1:568-726(+)
MQLHPTQSVWPTFKCQPFVLDVNVFSWITYWHFMHFYLDHANVFGICLFYHL